MRAVQLLADLVLKHTDVHALDACLGSIAHCAAQDSHSIQVCPGALPFAALVHHHKLFTVLLWDLCLHTIALGMIL